MLSVRRQYIGKLMHTSPKYLLYGIKVLVLKYTCCPEITDSRTIFVADNISHIYIYAIV